MVRGDGVLMVSIPGVICRCDGMVDVPDSKPGACNGRASSSLAIGTSSLNVAETSLGRLVRLISLFIVGSIPTSAIWQMITLMLSVASIGDDSGLMQGVLCWYGSLTLNQEDGGSIPSPATNADVQTRPKAG
jgi:hypothetical protein